MLIKLKTPIPRPEISIIDLQSVIIDMTPGGAVHFQYVIVDEGGVCTNGQVSVDHAAYDLALSGTTGTPQEKHEEVFQALVPSLSNPAVPGGVSVETAAALAASGVVTK